MSLSQEQFERNIARMLAAATREARLAAIAKQAKPQGYVIVREHVRQLPRRKRP